MAHCICISSLISPDFLTAFVRSHLLTHSLTAVLKKTQSNRYIHLSRVRVRRSLLTSTTRHSRRHTEAPKSFVFLRFFSHFYGYRSAKKQPAYRSLFAAVEFGRNDGSVISAGTANSPHKRYLTDVGQMRGLHRLDGISCGVLVSWEISFNCRGHVKSEVGFYPPLILGCLLFSNIRTQRKRWPNERLKQRTC